MHIRSVSFTLTCVLIGLCSAGPASATGYVSKFDNLDQNRWYVANGWSNGDYQTCEWRSEGIATDNGSLQIKLADNRSGKLRPVSCGEIHTNERNGYGLYEARMRSASGSGLDTGFFTYIGPPNGVPEWDEIDFEFLGKNPHAVQLNYYVNGKGGHETTIPLDYDASKEFHNYAFEWTPLKIRWYIDGKMVHETPDGVPLPHNPGSLFLNLWSGGKGQDAWLGPFNYTAPTSAEVTWAAFTPPNEACQFPESLRCKK